MASSDAILIGEEWISEHFFTTDATSQSFQALVTGHRKAWEEDKDKGTPLTRFAEARRWLVDRLSTLGEPSDDTGLIPDAAEFLPEVYQRVRTVLGYDGVGLHITRSGPVLRISAPGMTEGSPLAIVEAAAVGSVEALLAKDAPTLREPFVVDEKTTLNSATRTISALFVADD